MIIPVAGIVILNLSTGIFHDCLIMINAFALGSGFLLYIGLFSLMLQRHYLIAHLPHILAPTIWIHLAPIGWGGVSLVSLAQHFGGLRNFSALIGGLLWGGCIWWFIMCIILTLKATCSHQMKFSLAYWAFIFPLCAITILSFRLGGPFMPAFYCLWCLTLIFWMIAACKTLKSFAQYVKYKYQMRRK